MKIEKDGVIKDIIREKEQGDYIAAGWKKVDDVKKTSFSKLVKE